MHEKKNIGIREEEVGGSDEKKQISYCYNNLGAVYYIVKKGEYDVGLEHFKKSFKFFYDKAFGGEDHERVAMMVLYIMILDMCMSMERGVARSKP